MNWFTNFYKRQKNPWIGFVLVILLGPFGFLYHSWKTTLTLFLIVGPLWIAFLRHTKYDLIENPWAHYVALFVCAGFASLQIKAHNTRSRENAANPTEGDRILDVAISYLPADEERTSFISFLHERPSLALKFLHSAALVIDKPACWRFSTLFDEIGVALAKRGGFPCRYYELGVLFFIHER